MKSEVDSFIVESIIRGYHIYKEVWSSVIGSEKCWFVAVTHKITMHDPFAVATCKGTTVVECIPKWISTICYVFLGKPQASIACFVAGSRDCIV